jgi:hypothetical protein
MRRGRGPIRLATSSDTTRRPTPRYTACDWNKITLTYRPFFQNQPFHSWKWINLDFSREICAVAFNGWKSDPQVDWINQNYGDIHIAGTNILFPSGTIDPWHALG